MSFNVVISVAVALASTANSGHQLGQTHTHIYIHIDDLTPLATTLLKCLLISNWSARALFTNIKCKQTQSICRELHEELPIFSNRWAERGGGREWKGNESRTMWKCGYRFSSISIHIHLCVCMWLWNFDGKFQDDRISLFMLNVVTPSNDLNIHQHQHQHPPHNYPRENKWWFNWSNGISRIFCVPKSPTPNVRNGKLIIIGGEERRRVTESQEQLRESQLSQFRTMTRTVMK